MSAVDFLDLCLACDHFVGCHRDASVGDAFRVTSEVNIGELQPDEVDVELYYGNLKSPEEVSASHVAPMTVLEARGNGNYLYGCDLICEISGQFGYTVRVTPHGDERIKSTPRLLTWA